jgi:hypothetical protein
MDDASLQSHGSYALALVRRFGEMPLPLAPVADSVYFNLGNVLVDYPEAWSPVIGAALAAILAGVLLAVRRRCGLRTKGVVLGLLATVTIVAAAGIIGYAYLGVQERLHRHWEALSFGQIYGRGWRTAAILTPVALLTWLAVSWLCRRLGRRELAAGVALALCLFSVVLCWYFPAASYLTAAPAVGAVLILAAVSLWPVAAAGVIPAILIWTPLVRYLDAGLGIAAWPVEAVLVALTTVLAAAGLAPQRLAVRRVLWAALALTAVLVTAGAVTGKYSARQPRPANAFYALDADRNAAYWVSGQPVLDPWTASVLGPHAIRTTFPAISGWRGDLLFWRSPAPVFPLSLPQLEVVSSTCAAGARTFDLKLRSARGAHGVVAIFQSDRRTELSLLNERPPWVIPGAPTSQPKALYVSLYGVPTEGVALRVRIQGCGALVARLVERTNDLGPVFPGGVPPMPAGIMTAWEDDYYNRSVIVTRRVRLE